MIDFIDLFSGIGGFRIGLEKIEGFRCVWSCDISKPANRIYYKRFKPEKGTHFAGDVKRVDPKKIPNHDLLTAGFPCQAFSDAGKRGGFKDPRGTLFFEIERIARAKTPPLLLLENVPGLLWHDEGRTFATILHVLDELGYDAEWWVLNSGYWVPQQRNRVFIIGHLRERPTPFMFPILDLCERMPKVDEKIPHISTLTATYSRDGYGGGRPYLIHRGIGPEGKSPMRSLTPLEFERLQGFPDGWTKGETIEKRIYALGNAVTIDVVTQIGIKIKEAWENGHL